MVAIAPAANRKADQFLAPLNVAIERFGIDSPARQAAFIAQILHESLCLTRMTESFNYSPANLMATFNTPKLKRFSLEAAERLGRTAAHPAAEYEIANIAYADRMGNGSIVSGDGWRYRGRGPGMLTGLANYAKCGADLGIDLLRFPDQVAQPDVGCLAFAWFWKKGNPTGRDLGLLADIGQYSRVSQAVNGGSNGLQERLALTTRALEVLA